MSVITEAIDRVAKRLHREVSYIDSAGYTNEITAAVVDPHEDRFACVQCSWKDRNGAVDIAYTLYIYRGEQLQADWELASYNPYFGCSVYWIHWVGEHVLLAYEEKHRHVLASVSMTGNAKLISVSRNLELRDHVIFYQPRSSSLMYAAALPSLDPLYPLPIAWLHEQRHLPTQQQQRLPHDVPAFQQRVVRRCFGDHPPQPLADFLVGAFTHWFWCLLPVGQANYHDIPREPHDSLQWFPLFRYQMLPTEEEAQQYLNVLDQLAVMPIAELGEEHSALEWATESAAATVQYWAAILAQACRANQLPNRSSCFFWSGEYPLGRLRQSLPLFPEGFVSIFVQLLPHRDQWSDFCKREQDRYLKTLREQQAGS